jgi:uncharacterized integral membrane protein
MADEREPAETGKPGRTRQLVGFGLLGLAVVFAAVNLDEVSVNWVVATWDTPLIIVIAVSLVAGAGLGFLAGRRRAAR